MRRLHLILAVSTLTALLAGTCSPGQDDPQARLVIRETSLGRPEGALLVVSPDRRRVAWKVRRNGKDVAVVDGVEGKPYDRVDFVFFSPDSKRVAYAAERGEKWLIVADGVEGREYDWTRSAPLRWPNRMGLTFSPDGKRLAYPARRGDRGFMVVDGEEGKPFSHVNWPHFSPDGNRLAYEACRRGMLKEAKIKQLLVVDGTPGREYDFIAGVYFSPDGSRLAYVAHCDDEVDKYVVVLDGAKGKKYDAVVGHVQFSPDSRRVAYVARRGGAYYTGVGGKHFVVIDGAEGKEYDAIKKGLVVEAVCFGPDGKRVAYVAIRDGKQVAVIDGVEGRAYERIGDWPREGPGADLLKGPGGRAVRYHPPLFGPDGSHVAYMAERGGKAFVVLDGVESDPYDVIVDNSLVFSTEGKRLAFVAKRGGKQLAVVDGVEGKEYDSVGEVVAVFTGGPMFSPDGSRVAYVARRGEKWLSVVDGVESREYDDISYHLFSDEGRRLVFTAQRNGRDIVVVDGVAVGEFQSATSPQISPDGKRVAFAARRDDNAFVVVDGVEGKPYTAINYDGIFFSEDSRHMAYIAHRCADRREYGEGGGKCLIVVDGMETKEYDRFLTLPEDHFWNPPRLVFDGANRLHALGSRDGEVFLVEVEVCKEPG